jgi:hypothetical protein
MLSTIKSVLKIMLSALRGIPGAVGDAFTSAMTPPPPGNRGVTTSQAYSASEDPRIKQIVREVLALNPPDDWKPGFEKMFRSALASEPNPDLGRILRTVHHPCFKVRVRSIRVDEIKKSKRFEELEAPAEVIQANKSAGIQMFIKEVIGGFATHPADFELDATGMPVASLNSRTGEVYGLPPPTGCGLARSVRYAGKRKTKKRKAKRKARKTIR